VENIVGKMVSLCAPCLGHAGHSVECFMRGSSSNIGGCRWSNFLFPNGSVA
jgi:hypothetical protein